MPVHLPLLLAAALAAPNPPAPSSAKTATSADPWAQWAPLVGNWDADPDATGATGGFTLAPELDGKVLVRHSHSEGPKTAQRPAYRHLDLMVISAESGSPRAEYWDNEGHHIRYSVTLDAAQHRAVFLSDAQPNAPRFRLTYDWTNPAKLSIVFEIAAPNAPDRFHRYIGGTAHRLVTKPGPGLK